MSNATDDSDEAGGEDADGQPPGDGQPIVRAGGVTVTSNGRCVIPAAIRNSYGIEEGDAIDVAIDTGDDICWIFDAIVGDRGRIGIPEHKATLYGIEGGDELDMEIRVTDKSLPAGG